MQREEVRQIVADARTDDLEAMQKTYLAELERCRMQPELLQACTRLELRELEKSTARNLRQLKRSIHYKRAEYVYLQINPQKNWSVAAGLVAWTPAWDREILYRSQTDQVEGRGSNEAARIYYDSRNCPWEEEAERYLLVRTLWSLVQIVRKEQLPKQVLAGVSRETSVFCLWDGTDDALG